MQVRINNCNVYYTFEFIVHIFINDINIIIIDLRHKKKERLVFKLQPQKTKPLPPPPLHSLSQCIPLLHLEVLFQYQKKTLPISFTLMELVISLLAKTFVGPLTPFSTTCMLYFYFIYFLLLNNIFFIYLYHHLIKLYILFIFISSSGTFPSWQ